jgi:hypothetical protein
MPLPLPFGPAEFFKGCLLYSNEDVLLPTALNLNPWKDAILWELYVTLFGLQSHIDAAPPNYTAQYWQHMSREDNLRAEAQRDAYQDLLCQCYNMIELRIAELIESSGQPLLPDNPAELKKIGKRVAERMAFDHKDILDAFETLDRPEHKGKRIMLYNEFPVFRRAWASISPLIPDNFLGARQYRHALQHGSSDFTGRLLAEGPVVQRQLREWRDRDCHWQVAINQSLLTLYRELSIVGQELNHLKGPAAKGRALLVDYNIPLPTPATTLAWWMICGLEAVWLSKTELYLCMTHPHLPVTHEHRGARKSPGAMGSDIGESHSDHSLPAASQGHDRSDEFERINHGLSLCAGMVFEIPNEAQPTAARIKIGPVLFDQSDSADDAIVHTMRSTLPQMPRATAKNRAFFPNPHILDSKIQNPWTAAHESIPIGSLGNGFPYSTGLRCMGEGGLHFAMRDSDEGWKMAQRWVETLAGCVMGLAIDIRDHPLQGVRRATMSSIAYGHYLHGMQGRNPNIPVGATLREAVKAQEPKTRFDVSKFKTKGA